MKRRSPCPDEKIAEAEKFIGYVFPEELKRLLREMDGDGWLLLSAEEMMENVACRREIFPEAFDEREEFLEKVDRYVLFATNGCGDYYGYRVSPDGVTDDSVVCIWEHELFESRKVAENIADLIRKYYNDEV